MDLPESGYEVILYNTALYMSSYDLDQLARADSFAARSVTRLVSNDVFWKRKLEEALGMSFSPAQQPGKTTWREKYLMVERAWLMGLLLSEEVFDISVAYALMDKADVEEIASEGFIVAWALESGDEERIKFIATMPEFDFKDLAKMAMVGTLYLEDENGQPVDPPVLSSRVLEMLVSPEFGLELDEEDYVKAMKWAIASDNLDGVAFLSQWVDLSGGGYLTLAVEEDHLDVLEYLLSLEDVTVDADIVEDLYSLADQQEKLDILDLLTSHPRTKQYLD